MTVYVAGVTQALAVAAGILEKEGIGISQDPGWEVTDVLLDVPVFRPGGLTREALHTLLASLPRQVRLWGGNFNIEGYVCRDLLKDETYLWKNAGITARCALELADIGAGASVLILGWGRIGTYLGRMLSETGGDVTVAVRKETDLLRLQALGYKAVMLPALPRTFDLAINTVPCPVLDSARLGQHCTKLDLASVKGITGADVIHATGLPGRYAPEESGKLIAETILRLGKETES